MSDHSLPKNIERVIVPPIKCQGIKTKLINFIANSIYWKGEGRWIEPFLGSGVVLFNILPGKALVGDTNQHIINFYNSLKKETINELIVKDFLEETGVKLSEKGIDYYYEMRESFNNDSDPLKLLFLNRSGFNGIMRFNGSGKFNVPFGHKPERFRKAYVTKIVNQVRNIRILISNNDWTFIVSDWKNVLEQVNENDFVYLDPPYIGRHTDYYNGWNENDAVELSIKTQSLNCGFALSMWKENKYRINEHLNDYWYGNVERSFNHFYYVGSKENLRNKMKEALIIKTGFESSLGRDILINDPQKKQDSQLELFKQKQS